MPIITSTWHKSTVRGVGNTGLVVMAGNTGLVVMARNTGLVELVTWRIPQDSRKKQDSVDVSGMYIDPRPAMTKERTNNERTAHQTINQYSLYHHLYL